MIQARMRGRIMVSGISLMDTSQHCLGLGLTLPPTLERTSLLVAVRPCISRRLLYSHCRRSRFLRLVSKCLRQNLPPRERERAYLKRWVLSLLMFGSLLLEGF